MEESKWKTLKIQSSQEQVSEYILLKFQYNYVILIIYVILILVIFYIGIEDKLVATDGYGIAVTDEASAFYQDIKGQDNKNESNIGLMNQLFDGHGDKTSLTQL